MGVKAVLKLGVMAVAAAKSTEAFVHGAQGARSITGQSRLAGTLPVRMPMVASSHAEVQMADAAPGKILTGSYMVKTSITDSVEEACRGNAQCLEGSGALALYNLANRIEVNGDSFTYVIDEQMMFNRVDLPIPSEAAAGDLTNEVALQGELKWHDSSSVAFVVDGETIASFAVTHEDNGDYTLDMQGEAAKKYKALLPKSMVLRPYNPTPSTSWSRV